MEKSMSVVTIDGKEFETDEMSEEQTNQLRSINFADQEVVRLEMLLAVTRTARNAYANALAGLLEPAEES
jgi:hypothetical protein